MTKFFVAVLILFTSLSAHAAETSAINVGIGPVKFNANIQLWSAFDSDRWSTNAGGGWDFRLRRGEMRFSGSVTERVRWFSMFDVTKSPALSTTGDNKILQDIGAGIALTPEMELVVGQFKIPTLAESMDSSSELLFPDRSAAGRYFGEKRSPGAMLTYTNGVVKAGVMISNGQTTNADDSTNNKKDVAARVEFTPPELRSVTAGGFANMADWGLSFRTRYGFNLRHNWRDWIFRGEYIHALDSTDVGRPATHSDAFIFDAGYMILSDRLQGVARFDTFASNATSFESARAYNLGLNYFLKGHNAKVQVWASRLHNFLGSYGSYTITGPGLANAPSPGTWLGVVALQVAI